MLYQPGAQPHRGETTGDSAGQDGWKGEKAYLWPTLLHSGQDIRCFNIQLFKTGFWLTTWAQLWLDQLCEGARGQTGEHLDPTLKTFKPGVNVPLPKEIFKVDIKEESPAWGFILIFSLFKIKINRWFFRVGSKKAWILVSLEETLSVRFHKVALICFLPKIVFITFYKHWRKDYNL